MFNGEHAKKKKKNTEAEIDLTYTCGVINSVVIVDSKYDEMRKLLKKQNEILPLVHTLLKYAVNNNVSAAAYWQNLTVPLIVLPIEE